jgi:hypothetical protein
MIHWICGKQDPLVINKAEDESMTYSKKRMALKLCAFPRAGRVIAPIIAKISLGSMSRGNSNDGGQYVIRSYII